MSARITFHPLRVARVDRLCDDAFAVTFDVPAELADAYAHTAGQYLTFRFDVDGRDERRSYSICTPVGERLRIGVRRVAGGLFSDRILRHLRPGDLIEVSPPQGRFTPPAGTHDRHHGFIAAGSGITPVLSIISTLLGGDPATRVSLIYGNRGSSTAMFAGELSDLKDRYLQRLHLVHVLSREAGVAEVLSGRLDADRLGTLLDRVIDMRSVECWWLCGPHGMVVDAAEVLANKGVPPEAVHRELFYVDAPPVPPPRSDDTETAQVAATMTLAGRSWTVGIPAGMPILDAALRTHTDMPFACRSGVCGTCRAKLTDGTVRQLRNYALGQYEVTEGFVLTCQAVPTSDSVAVDYDA